MATGPRTPSIEAGTRIRLARTGHQGSALAQERDLEDAAALALRSKGGPRLRLVDLGAFRSRLLPTRADARHRQSARYLVVVRRARRRVVDRWTFTCRCPRPQPGPARMRGRL